MSKHVFQPNLIVIAMCKSNLFRRIFSLIIPALLTWIPLSCHGEVATTLPTVNEFIATMAQQHGFKVAALRGIFEQVILRPEIIEAISRPAEGKPWFEYRAIFLTPERINEGIGFWRKHQDALAIAESRYGVDPAVIVAIIGVETRYGTRTGAYRIIDSLTTLAFQYPKRAPFFRDQLVEYLLLTRAEGVDPLSLKGSYAGAMGLPQFMPTSFRDFAVDLDGDHHRDLWNNPVDAIGSVANYLSRHAWQPRAPIAVSVNLGTKIDPTHLVDKEKNLKPNQTLDYFRAQGLQPTKSILGNPAAVLLRLAGKDLPEYWFGFQNFYAITRYNHSPLYAMAVYQLAQEIMAGTVLKP